MGRHVHFKDGKFNIWSTIIDAYELKEWVSEEVIVEAFKELAVTRAIKEAKELCLHARNNNGCSIPYADFRCNEI